MRIAIALLALPLAAQTLTSTAPGCSGASCTFYLRGMSPTIGLTLAGAPPRAQYSLTATGGWQARITGALSSSLGITVTPTSGTGNATLQLVTLAAGNLPMVAGNYSGAIEVCQPTCGTAAASMAINLVVEQPLGWGAFSGPTSCTFPADALRYDPVRSLCAQPSPGTVSPVAVGSTYNDPITGKAITRIGANGWRTFYSSWSALNADGTRAVVIDNIGSQQIVDASTGALIQSSIGSGWAWSQVTTNRLYRLSGATIETMLVGGAPTVIADYSATMPGISNGDDRDPSADDWWAFGNNSSISSTTVSCIVNLNGLTIANQASKTFCVNRVAPIPVQTNGFSVTALDGQGYRYLYETGVPSNSTARFDGTALSTPVRDTEIYGWTGGNDDGLCQTDENCAVSHFDLAKIGDRVGWVDETQGPAEGFSPYLMYMRFADASKIEKQWPIEGGGGTRWVFPLAPTTNITRHFSARGHWVVVSTTARTAETPAFQVSAATAANPTVLTTVSAHGRTTGDSVIVGGGNACMVGVRTATVISSTQLSIPADCSGMGSYNGAGVVAQYVTDTDFAGRGQIWLIDLRNGDSELMAVSMNHSYTSVSGRGVPTDPVGGEYTTGQPHASLSPDATRMCFSTNFGFPQAAIAHCMPTGVTHSTPPRAERWGVSVSPGSTRAVIRYTAPSESACNVELWTTPSRRTSRHADTDSGPEIADTRAGSITNGRSRQFVAGTSSALTANTNYWGRLTCVNGTNTETAHFQFRTLAAGASAVTHTFSRASAATAEHSANADMSSATSLGSAATQTVSVAQGSVRYFRWAGGLIEAVVTP